MPLEIAGQPTSAEVREILRKEGKPVILSFSCGKDSTAAWIALHEAKIPVIPIYNYLVPGLKFVEEELEYFEDFFGQRIIQVPHPTLYRWLEYKVFQAPENNPVIEAARFGTIDYKWLWDAVRKDFDMPDAWVADGIRASDSIARRMACQTHGVMRNGRVSPIYDWTAQEVRDCLDEHGVEVPIDYQIWGRSFDGLDVKYIRGLYENLPEDYQRVKEWFPLIDIELMRQEVYGGLSGN